MLLLFGYGCSSAEPEPNEVIQPVYCEPLSADACALPWPSSFYLKSDDSTPTGYRLDYPQEIFPVSAQQAQIDPAPYQHLDGYSVGSQILVYFAAGISAAQLPGQADLARSVAPQSLVLLFDMNSGERVPFFAELDANVKGDEIPGVIIRPQIPLRFNSRYAVVLRAGLADAEGIPLVPPDPFRRLRDGQTVKSEALNRARNRLEEVFDFLAQQNIVRGEILLAWDFHTASQETVIAPVRSIVEDSLTRMASTAPSVADVQEMSVEDPTVQPDLLRAISATMSVPSYLESDLPDSRLKLDASGRPVFRGWQAFPLLATIPRCAEKATQPLPVLIFGHGLFSHRDELLTPYHTMLGQRLCMISVATNWIGLSRDDLIAVARDVIPNLSNMPRITDPLQQAQVNVAALVEVMRGSFLQHTLMQVNGQPITDGQTIYYLGISNGGIQGMAFAALQKRIERFVLNVLGGVWSMMLQRSSNFDLLATALEGVYPAALDRLFLFSLTQHLWDYTDPVSFSAFPLRDPLPGQRKKRLLVQEAIFDDQVPNIATRTIIRGLGIEALTPLWEEVYGVTAREGPLDSAYVQWYIEQQDNPPLTNVPAPKLSDEESAHQLLRQQETCIKQLENFFTSTGKVIQTCSGPCDPS